MKKHIDLPYCGDIYYYFLDPLLYIMFNIITDETHQNSMTP